MNDSELAVCLAAAAGQLLLELQKRGSTSETVLGEEGDYAANAYLCAALRSERPDDALLSEEEADCTSRCSANRVWIIDPLDGTREYSEGRDDWAVHVALAVDGIASVGAVALPSVGLILSSATPPMLATPNRPLKMVVSRTRPAAEAVRIANEMEAELVRMGSAGAKAMAVVQGAADIYLHTGGQFEWDNCAPVAVAQAAGLHCSRVDGAPLRYNNANPYLPDLLICRPELATEILALVKTL